MVNELLLDHDVLLGVITFIDRAVASLKATGASEPSRSAAGLANMIPVSAEQVDALVAFCTVIQMMTFVPTMLADRAEASGKRLVDTTV